MPGRERILLIWYRPFAQGGVETFLLHFARAAVARGDEVWIAATHDATGPLQEAMASSGAALVDWSGFGEAFMGRGTQQAVREKIQLDLASIQPTWILLNDCNAFSIGAAPVLRRARAFATVTDLFHIDSPDPQYLDMRAHFADVLDGIASTNRSVVSRFASRVPAFAGLPMTYIPNGVPPCVAEHEAPRETLKLLFVGRLAQSQKRVLALPALFEELRKRRREFTATICGDGPDGTALAALLREKRLDDRVTLVGYRTPSQVQELLLSHDVLVNVSSFEGFSMSLLEALAAGCVPTCTGVASIDRERLVDGVNCILVPPERPEALVDAWMDLTPARLAQLSRQCRESASALTSQACFEAHRAFALQVRAARALEPWPGTPVSRLDWDITRNNPWLPRRQGLRGAMHALRRKVFGT
jgi:glycosyltransferase involved in cell wall biosynthesis